MEQDGPRYVVDRPTYNIADFDKDFDKKDRQFPVGERVTRLFRYKILYMDTYKNYLEST